MTYNLSRVTLNLVQSIMITAFAVTIGLSFLPIRFHGHVLNSAREAFPTQDLLRGTVSQWHHVREITDTLRFRRQLKTVVSKGVP